MPGMGKSRLVREVVDQIAAGARTLRGRCLPYGEGITFWPLVGMVREAADIRDEDHPDAARAKLLQAVKDPEVAARLASAVGLSEQSFPLHELYWGARKFLEGLAADDPVVAVIDDIHWAEPAFLDLLVHILDASSGAAILLLATARHDLLETQPQWGERASSTRLVLRPLSDAASAQVVGNLLGSAGLPPDVVERIVVAAEGNPLYVEQMLSMLIDSGALRREGAQWVRAEGYGEITVPPTIKALLEARLDGLARADRATVEPASVIGVEFERPAIEALAPDAVRPEIGKHLDTLARKHFIDLAERRAGRDALSLPSPPGARHGLQRPAQARTRQPAPGLRALGRQGQRRARPGTRVRGDPRLPPRAGLPLPGRTGSAGRGRRGHRRRCRRAPGRAPARRAFARSDMHAAANLLRRASALLAADSPAAPGTATRTGRGADGVGRTSRRRASCFPKPLLPRRRSATSAWR